MRNLFDFFVHLVGKIIRLSRLGGLRSVVAESVLLKQQTLILNRSRRRTPNLRALDWLIADFCLFFWEFRVFGG